MYMMDIKRVGKIRYYLDIADSVSKRSTCLRRQYGSVIVKNDEIISTGYNGAPRGMTDCLQKGSCVREKLNVPRGTMYEKCIAVHAEMNAIISASRRDMIGSTLYLSGREVKTGELVKDATPCAMCLRAILNSGIDYIYINANNADGYKLLTHIDFFTIHDKIMENNGY